jgi:hypothetical protein
MPANNEAAYDPQSFARMSQQEQLAAANALLQQIGAPRTAENLNRAMLALHRGESMEPDPTMERAVTRTMGASPPRRQQSQAAPQRGGSSEDERPDGNPPRPEQPPQQAAQEDEPVEQSVPMRSGTMPAPTQEYAGRAPPPPFNMPSQAAVDEHVQRLQASGNGQARSVSIPIPADLLRRGLIVMMGRGMLRGGGDDAARMLPGPAAPPQVGGPGNMLALPAPQRALPAPAAAAPAQATRGPQDISHLPPMQRAAAMGPGSAADEIMQNSRQLREGLIARARRRVSETSGRRRRSNAADDQ